jgi:hypothetical protein
VAVARRPAYFIDDRLLERHVAEFAVRRYAMRLIRA